MSGARVNLSSGSPWEPIAGFSRAVVVGDRVLVSGTAAYGPDGGIVGAGDAAAQARRCFEIVLDAVRRAGGSPRDVVRTRMYVTDRGDCEAVARVHGEVFGGTRPATTLVVVAALVDAALRVEVEAEAVLGAGGASPPGPILT